MLLLLSFVATEAAVEMGGGCLVRGRRKWIWIFGSSRVPGVARGSNLGLGKLVGDGEGG
jgi:hypothetical protein